MPWVKIDDQITFNPKLMAAGNAAVGIWIRMIAHSAAQLTDGYITGAVSVLIAGRSRAQINTLIATGLLHKVDGGYLLNDYLEYNPSRAEVLEKRERDRLRKGGKPKPIPDGKPTESERLPDTPSRPVPTRPDPTRKDDVMGDDSVTTLDDLGVLGFNLGFGMITPRDVPAVNKLLPISMAEFDMALAETQARATKPGWGYLTSCLASARKKPPPPKRDLKHGQIEPSGGFGASKI